MYKDSLVNIEEKEKSIFIKYNKEKIVVLPIFKDDLGTIKEYGTIDGNLILFDNIKEETSLDSVLEYFKSMETILKYDDIHFLGTHNINLGNINFNEGIFHFYYIEVEDKNLLDKVKFEPLSKIMEVNDIVLLSIFLEYYMIKFSQFFK